MAGDEKHPRELIAEAGKHAEGPAQRCDCGRPGCDGQTYCTWCGNEWPCLPRELADALAAALPGDDDWEYRCRLRSADPSYEHTWVEVDADHQCDGELQRRRPAVDPGPWEPVEEVPRG